MEDSLFAYLSFFSDLRYNVTWGEEMFEEINQELKLLEEKVFIKDTVRRQLKRLKKDLEEHKRTRTFLFADLKKEQKDVDQLKNTSLASLFYSIIGQKAQKLEEEEKEVLEAKLKVDKMDAELSVIEAEIEYEVGRLREIEEAEFHYDALLKKKKEQVLALGPKGDKIREKEREIGVLKKILQEIFEAVRAGQKAKQSLHSASDTLRSARNWGVYDILSDDSLISSLVKQNKVKNAQVDMARANRYLKSFQAELEDVKTIRQTITSELEFSTLVKSLDIWLDNIFTDFHVQRRINNARNDVSSTIGKVDGAISKLRANQEEIKRQIHAYEKEIEDYIKELE
jgi:DNA repair exonuclease SbcCD ATPase subunit